jgi:hypothetical protein
MAKFNFTCKIVSQYISKFYFNLFTHSSYCILAVAQLVKTMRYKPEGRRYDSRWCYWNSYWLNPSGRSMVAGSTQLLAEISIRNVSSRIKAAGEYGWQPYKLHVQNSYFLYRDCLTFFSYCNMSHALALCMYTFCPQKLHVCVDMILTRYGCCFFKHELPNGLNKGNTNMRSVRKEPNI